MKIDIEFADPTQVADSDRYDLVLTFWHGDLFIIEETGEPIPNGYEIFTELAGQAVDPNTNNDFTKHGENMAGILIFILTVGTIASLVCHGSLLPVYSLFETIQLISHLPLIYTVALPDQLFSFLKPINDLFSCNFRGTAKQDYAD